MKEARQAFYDFYNIVKARRDEVEYGEQCRRKNMQPLLTSESMFLTELMQDLAAQGRSMENYEDEDKTQARSDPKVPRP